MSNNKLEEYYGSEHICSWKQLSDFYESLFGTKAQWIFRGQSRSDWGLKSRLEREIANFGLDLRKAADFEHGLLRKFKRQCHHYIPHTPGENDPLEWLALMQHYGTPTRLLDWTYSFFVALYFAIESADECGCAVWALNTDWMRQPFETILHRHPIAFLYYKRDPNVLRPATFKKLFMRKSPIELVGAVTPHRLNERLVIQQGVFLCPGDVSQPFEKNLIALLSKRTDSRIGFTKVTIQVDLETRNKILVRLQRMNLNHATLFPGLEGFARSLRTLMANPKFFLAPGNDRTT